MRGAVTVPISGKDSFVTPDGMRGAPFPRLLPWVSLTLLLAILLAPSTRFDTAFEFVMIVAVFPLLVWASARDTLEPHHGQWMLVGGTLSYPLYILHFPLAALLAPRLAAALSPLAALVGAMHVALAASQLALRYYDEPVRAWLSGMFSRSGVAPLMLRRSLPGS